MVSVARWRGLTGSRARYPGLADSPWATRCRPLARACGFARSLPRARGLSLGYTLSPRWRGLAGSRARYPGLPGSPRGTRCRPAGGGLRVRALAGSRRDSRADSREADVVESGRHVEITALPSLPEDHLPQNVPPSAFARPQNSIRLAQSVLKQSCLWLASASPRAR